eukprot:jgi/Mesen1/3538/ME000198S02738
MSYSRVIFGNVSLLVKIPHLLCRNCETVPRASYGHQGLKTNHGSFVFRSEGIVCVTRCVRGGSPCGVVLKRQFHRREDHLHRRPGQGSRSKFVKLHSLDNFEQVSSKTRPLATQKQQVRRCQCSMADSEEITARKYAPKVKQPWAPKINFCPACGGAVEQRVPAGEQEPRAVCTNCSRVHYINPKMVVCCLVEHDGHVLLCKRRIEPCAGLWTLPGGYMELGESAPEGAIRETWEEANADVTVVAPYAHLDIPLIGQSYLVFRARFADKVAYGPGAESLETVLFKLDDIPFDSIAFSAVRVALEKYVEDARLGRYHVHLGVIDKRSGAAPNDPDGFSLKNYIAAPGESFC